MNVHSISYQYSERLIMNTELNQDTLDRLYYKARTFHSWEKKEVETDILLRLYDLLKWAPTCVNGSPARFVFIKSTEHKENLISTLLPKNVEKTRSAPITVIIAEDLNWHKNLSKLMPHADYYSHFENDQNLRERTGLRNSSLQGGYMIMAARSLGLDCGPMSGFDNEKLDSIFFDKTTWRSNFLCNLGYGNRNVIFPRLPRLNFDEACLIL